MTKVISLSDDAYYMLKDLKGERCEFCDYKYGNHLKNYDYANTNDLVDYKKLKKEVIKWLKQDWKYTGSGMYIMNFEKENEKTFDIFDWIKHFFNLKNEETR